MLRFKLNPLTGSWNMYDDGAVLPMYTISNPATNVAVLTSVLDNYSGVIVTTTMSGNGQTMQAPTITTPGRTFTIVNNDTSTHSINVNGITVSPGEAQRFIFDGSSWIAVTAIDAQDITFTPTGTIAATNIQTAIAEVNSEKNILNASSYLYLGDASTNGTWRIGRSGDDLIFQRMESDSWVTKHTISA